MSDDKTDRDDLQSLPVDIDSFMDIDALQLNKHVQYLISTASASSKGPRLITSGLDTNKPGLPSEMKPQKLRTKPPQHLTCHFRLADVLFLFSLCITFVFIGWKMYYMPVTPLRISDSEAWPKPSCTLGIATSHLEQATSPSTTISSLTSAQPTFQLAENEPVNAHEDTHTIAISLPDLFTNNKEQKTISVLVSKNGRQWHFTGVVQPGQKYLKLTIVKGVLYGEVELELTGMDHWNFKQLVDLGPPRNTTSVYVRKETNGHINGTKLDVTEPSWKTFFSPPTIANVSDTLQSYLTGAFQSLRDSGKNTSQIFTTKQELLLKLAAAGNRSGEIALGLKEYFGDKFDAFNIVWSQPNGTSEFSWRKSAKSRRLATAKDRAQVVVERLQGQIDVFRRRLDDTIDGLFS